MIISSATGKLVDRLRRVARRRAEQQWEAAAIRTNPDAGPYQGLTPRSLAFATLRLGPATPAVNLVLPAYNTGATFAGIKTALQTGAQVAQAEDRHLRVIALRGSFTPSVQQAFRDLVQAEFGLDRDRVTLTSVETCAATDVATDDLWIATYWTTAHAIDVACRLDLIDRCRVIYLVQDYEPAFLPASTASALAASTYRAGFTLLVNSSPLADYIRRYEGVPIPDAQVFAPSLDLARLQQAQQARRPTPIPSVLFYGRPSKPRNMFPLGVAALRAAARRLTGREVTFRSVGERHRDVVLAGGHMLRSVGKLSWSGYFEMLAEAQFVLSLQASPHPSHPPLDAVVSGAVAVTNELGGTRGGRHDRLIAVAPDPDEMATALVAAIEGHDPDPGAYAPELLAHFGHPLDMAARAAVSQLQR